MRRHPQVLNHFFRPSLATRINASGTCTRNDVRPVARGWDNTWRLSSGVHRPERERSRCSDRDHQSGSNGTRWPCRRTGRRRTLRRLAAGPSAETSYFLNRGRNANHVTLTIAAIAPTMLSCFVRPFALAMKKAYPRTFTASRPVRRSAALRMVGGRVDPPGAIAPRDRTVRSSAPLLQSLARFHLLQSTNQRPRAPHLIDQRLGDDCN